MSVLIIARLGFAISLYKVIRAFLERHNTGYQSFSGLVAEAMARLVNRLIKKFSTKIRASDEDMPLPILVVIILVPDCTSCAFIIVEAFNSLLSLPIEVDKTPDWAG